MNPADVQDIYPLSPMQEGMLFHALAEPRSAAYFIQMSFEFAGRFDAEVFGETWRALFRRHDILRTAFFHEKVSRPQQVVLKERAPEVSADDLRGLAPAEQRRVLDACRASDRARGFDLQRDVLMRLRVFRLSDSLHEFVWSYHHVLMDGWCMGILQREFVALYDALLRGGRPALRPPRPYRDYIHWLQRRDPASARDYWARRLAGYERLTGVPALAARGGADYEHREHHLVFDEEVTGRLKRLAASLPVTLNTLVQGLWALLLSRYNDADEVLFAAVVSGRPAELSGVEETLGLFINAVPVRVSLEGAEGFAAVLRRLQWDALESEAHQHLPLSEVQSLSPLGRGLLDHVMVFDNYPAGEPDADAGESLFSVRALGGHDRTHYDFSLVVVPGPRLLIKFLYNAARYADDHIARTAAHFETAAHSVLREPEAPVSRLNILPDAERALLLESFQGARAAAPRHRTVVEWFEEQAARTPDAVAVVAGEVRLSYGELNARANHVASRLREEFGVDAESRVALLLGRSEELIVALLGVLKSGAAYVPIDPASPPHRIGHVLRDAACALVLTEPRCRESLPEDAPALAVDVSELRGLRNENTGYEVGPRQLAYVLYTSGSTGEPKGCQVEHGSLAYYLDWASRAYLEDGEGSFGLFTSLSFDLTLTSLFLPLLRGKILRVFAQDEDLLRVLAETFGGAAGVDCVKLTPSHVSLLAHAGLDSSPVRVAVVGGEAFTPHQAAVLHALNPAMRVFNEYGPTEATVGCVFKEVRAGEPRVLIGRPIDGASAYVLDRHMNPAPLGAAGELYVAGPGVARGYLNRDELTRERFLACPFREGVRMYRTGDVARRMPDGDLDYLGRNDDQLKVRGHRVEPGEVKSRVEEFDGVREAFVGARTPARADGGGDVELVAYVVWDAAPDALALGEHLRRVLPGHMVPSHFVTLDVMPLTSNGKVDRACLPDPAPAPAGAAGTDVAPRDETEEALARIWEEVLGAPTPGVLRSFFDLGGHSLKAGQVVARVRKKLGVELGLGEFLAAPTVAELAGLVRSRKAAPYAAIPPAPPQPHYALSHAQQRLWLLHRLGGEVAYNMPKAFVYEGELCAASLRGALGSLALRHEALRTAFAQVGGEPRQFILDEVAVPFREVDLRGEPSPDDAALRLAEREAATPFELDAPPLLRLTVMRLGERRHMLLLVMHHIIGDGWSLRVLFDELLTLYDDRTNERPDSLPPPAIQYKDFAAWQNSKDFGPDEAYWLRKLAGAAESLRLPYDAEPDSAARDFRGDSLVKVFSPEVSEGLARMAAAKGATLSDVVLSLFMLMLYKVSRQDDFCVGLSVANRTRAELEGLVGFFVNVLPIRARFTSREMEFDDLLAQTVRDTREAFAHQEYPFDRLIKKLNPARYANRQPLLNVVYTFQNFTDVRVGAEGSRGGGGSALARAREVPPPFRTSKFDLTLFAADAGGRLHLEMEYDTGLFARRTVGRFLGHLEHFAEALAGARD